VRPNPTAGSAVTDQKVDKSTNESQALPRT
jgi:hypothetical protein